MALELISALKSMRGMNISISEIQGDDIVLEDCDITYGDNLIVIKGNDEEGSKEYSIGYIEDYIVCPIDDSIEIRTKEKIIMIETW